jgi:uncharacterized membrane protein YfcA
VASGPVLVVCGALIASVSAMCGIGGGIFAVPVLHYVFGVPLKRAVATALCLVWFVAVSSTATELLHEQSALFGEVIALLVAGVLIGTQLGYEVAKRVPTRHLKGVFCVVLLLVGARILVGAGSEGLPPADSITLDVPGALTVGCIGIVAGIVVPLLGVGGGLVVVPALLLGLPQVGWDGARATSLAAAVVSSSRGLWLYHQDEMVDWRTGAWFGVGAAAGAVAGVQLVHRPGGDDVGQVLLGVVLVFAAVRFGLDFARRRPQAD